MPGEKEFAGDAGQRERVLTVARVRTRSDRADVMFFESARIYRLQRANPSYDDALRLLRRSAATGEHVVVEFVEANSDIIRRVRVHSSR
jgi:hypothetical protein